MKKTLRNVGLFGLISINLASCMMTTQVTPRPTEVSLKETKEAEYEQVLDEARFYVLSKTDPDIMNWFL